MNSFLTFFNMETEEVIHHYADGTGWGSRMPEGSVRQTLTEPGRCVRLGMNCELQYYSDGRSKALPGGSIVCWSKALPGGSLE